MDGFLAQTTNFIRLTYLRGLFLKKRASDIGDWKKVGHMIKGIGFLLVSPKFINPDKIRKRSVSLHFS